MVWKLFRNVARTTSQITMRRSAQKMWVRPISVLRFWISERLKHNLTFKGWNSHVHREFPGNYESTDLSRDNLSRKMWASCRGLPHCTHLSFTVITMHIVIFMFDGAMLVLNDSIAALNKEAIEVLRSRNLYSSAIYLCP